MFKAGAELAASHAIFHIGIGVQIVQLDEAFGRWRRRGAIQVHEPRHNMAHDLIGDMHVVGAEGVVPTAQAHDLVAREVVHVRVRVRKGVGRRAQRGLGQGVGHRDVLTREGRAHGNRGYGHDDLDVWVQRLQA
ncbi:hypothetical protein D3C75_978400 [compost metagenome]